MADVRCIDMSVISRMRNQKAVYWERQDPDQYGNFAYASPVQVDCRWDDKSEEFRDKNGETRLSNSIVYPDRKMATGDMLSLGELDSNTPSDPTQDDNAHEIQRFERISNFKATEFLNIAYL